MIISAFSVIRTLRQAQRGECPILSLLYAENNSLSSYLTFIVEAVQLVNDIYFFKPPARSGSSRAGHGRGLPVFGSVGMIRYSRDTA